MRRLAFVFALILTGGPLAAGTDAAPPTAGPDLSQVEAVLTAAGGHLAALDRLIARQEGVLDDLYLQREAAAEGDERGKVAQLDRLIDQMNLTLTHLETERDTMASQISALRAHIDQLGADTGQPGE